MKSPEKQQPHSSIVHHSLMLKIIALFLFNNRECFDGKLEQRKVAKLEVPNAFVQMPKLNPLYCLSDTKKALKDVVRD